MTSFNPMAAAADWFETYRAGSPSIVKFYAPDAFVECRCGGQKKLCGRAAIEQYFRERFLEKPKADLAALALANNGVLISYWVPGGMVQAELHFNDTGLIRNCSCGPHTLEAQPW